MKKSILLFILTTLFSVVNLLAQDKIGIGQWRIHLPYNDVISIAEGPEKLWVSAERGFYSMHLKSGEIELHSKVNGFSDVEVSKLAYHDGLNSLFIAYESTNIDILTKDKVIINISDILRKTILGIKKINDIHFEDDLAYLSCSFGIVVVDMVKGQIKDSYTSIGPGGTTINIESLTIYNDYIYAATSLGIIRAPEKGVNHNDFNTWTIFKSAMYTDHLKVFNGKMYAVLDSVINTFDGSDWLPFDGGEVRTTVALDVNHDKLVITQDEGLTILDEAGTLRRIGDKLNNYALSDHEDFIWCGGNLSGLKRIDKSNGYQYTTPNGPLGSTSFAMANLNSQIWVAGGLVNSSWQPTFNNRGYYWYDGQRWTNRIREPKLNLMFDFVSVATNERSGEVFMGTQGAGLLHLKNGNLVNIYDENNSTLYRTPGGFLNVPGVAFDEDGNLWASNYDSDEVLHVRTTDGQWHPFQLPITRGGELVVDRYGQKWMSVINESSIGLCVFKEDGISSGKGQVRLLDNTARSGDLPNTNVQALVIDQDGEIWVGTEEGLGIFYNPGLVFEGGENADAQRIIINDGNDIGYLLGTESIHDIQVDGANRKWCCTNTGVWLVEEDGSRVVHHFTTENSALLSNTVLCCAIDPVSGEVYFGTDKGIISYRSDATGANDKHGDVLVFPNPVRETYNGPITIEGLPRDASVKITDVAGRVVYELLANGGTAVWDGKDFNGRRPKTGIYLIFTANEDDEETMVSKLLLVN